MFSHKYDSYNNLIGAFMFVKKSAFLISLLTSGMLLGCSSTAETANSDKQTAKPATAKKQQQSNQQKQNQSFTGKNLLAYANPGFEKPLDKNFPKARQEKSQLNLAEFGPMSEAAKSGKQSLGIVLAKGDFKVQYGIWRLRDQINENKQYRFEFDAFLLEGHAQLFNQVDKSPWMRTPIENINQWQVVGNTIDGKFLKAGKPINLHIDNIKGKDTGILLIDNIRLYEIK